MSGMLAKLMPCYRFGENGSPNLRQSQFYGTITEVIPLKYDSAVPFSHGLARVWVNKKEGYIGRDGTEYFGP
jgi:hypothetical protein